jgi:putative ABC transport system permease protein
MTVVGVVRHVRSRTLEAPSRVQMYWPHAQDPWRTASLVVRTAGDPLALVNTVRQQVALRDPDQPVYRIRSMESVLSGALAQRQLLLRLIGMMAGMAMLLSAIGLYGVIAYSVAQRMHEFGIRLALGADRLGILRLIIGRGMVLTVIGCALGLAVTIPVRRAVGSLLYGIGPHDPLTVASVLLLLCGVSLPACYLPARRATRIDPSIALRQE